MPDVADDMIILKIERAQRAPQEDTNKYSTPEPLPIIAKFIDWNFSEKVKSNFIKAARASFQQHPAESKPNNLCLANILIISNTHRNKAMPKCKELKRDQRTTQVYIKYPAILMVNKSGERSYSAMFRILIIFLFKF